MGAGHLNFGVRPQNKLPVAVTLASASNPNVVIPTDIPACTISCGNSQWDFYTGIGADTPKVGDTYTFDMTYSDGTTGTLVATVVGWNNSSTLVGASAASSKLEPSGSSSTSTKPTFTWTDAPSDPSFAYTFYLGQYLGPTIWQVPGNNSNLNGFTSKTTSLTLGTDPTCTPSATCNPPSVSALTDGTVYGWGIQVEDAYGNQAVTGVNYIP
jgi:hypothetical protein